MNWPQLWLKTFGVMNKDETCLEEDTPSIDFHQPQLSDIPWKAIAICISHGNVDSQVLRGKESGFNQMIETLSRKWIRQQSTSFQHIKKRFLANEKISSAQNHTYILHNTFIEKGLYLFTIKFPGPVQNCQMGQQLQLNPSQSFNFHMQLGFSTVLNRFSYSIARVSRTNYLKFNTSFLVPRRKN